MLKLPKLTREIQLSWFEPGCRIKQDQELIDLIVTNGYTQAVAIGDVAYFADHISFVDSVTNFGIYIVNQPFNFIELVTELNLLINKITPGGLIYLSLNKYLAHPMQYDNTLSSDYDIAILEFIEKNVCAKIEKYFPCGTDGGNCFNWAHPLTRFYLRINDENC